MEIVMETWMAELAALVLLLACIVQGACQGLLLKLYSLVKVVLLLVGTAAATLVLLLVLPEGFAGREAIAFVAGLVLVGVILGGIEHALKIVDHIPVVKTLNKIGGAALGAVLGILLLWLLMFVITLGKDTAWCQEILLAVSQSTLLGELYRLNPLWALALHF